jgi:hypothetical protein
MNESEHSQLVADIVADMSADEGLQRLTGRHEQISGERVALREHIQALHAVTGTAAEIRADAVDALVRGEAPLPGSRKALAEAVSEAEARERLLADALSRIEAAITQRRREVYRAKHAARADRLQQEAAGVALASLLDLARQVAAAHEAAAAVADAAGVHPPRTYMPIATRPQSLVGALDQMTCAGAAVPKELAQDVRLAVRAEIDIAAKSRELRAKTRASTAERVRALQEQAAERLARKRAEFLRALGIDAKNRVGWSEAR